MFELLGAGIVNVLQFKYLAPLFLGTLIGVVGGALPGLGFRIATFAYVVAANALLAPPRGLRGWAGTAVLGLGTALLTWLVFERELSVLLPRGRWTHW